MMPPPPQSRPARTLVLIFISISCCLGVDVRSTTRNVRFAASRRRNCSDAAADDDRTTTTTVAASTDLGLDFHVDSPDVGFVRSTHDMCAASASVPVQMPSMTIGPPPPQSRPARTLVLIFMSILLTFDFLRSTARNALLTVRALAQMKSGPPQSRPARTLVLIFISISCCLNGGAKHRAEMRAASHRRTGSDAVDDDRTAATVAASTNLGFDLHFDSPDV